MRCARSRPSSAHRSRPHCAGTLGGGTGLSSQTVRLSPAVLGSVPWPAGDLEAAVTAADSADVLGCGRAVLAAYGCHADETEALLTWWARGLPPVTVPAALMRVLVRTVQTIDDRLPSRVSRRSSRARRCRPVRPGASTRRTPTGRRRSCRRRRRSAWRRTGRRRTAAARTPGAAATRRRASRPRARSPTPRGDARRVSGRAVAVAEHERGEALDADDDRAPRQHRPHPAAATEARRTGVGHHPSDERRIGSRRPEPHGTVERGGLVVEPTA